MERKEAMNKKKITMFLVFFFLIIGGSIYLKSKTYILETSDITNYKFVPSKQLTRNSELLLEVEKAFYKKNSTPSKVINNNNLYITLYAEGVPFSSEKEYTVKFDDFSNQELAKVKNIYIVNEEVTEISDFQNSSKLKVFPQK